MYAFGGWDGHMGIVDHKNDPAYFFYSGRRFRCLEVFLALFLSAPISLNAQSGSAPQSQPAQPAASAPTPPATQSQAPSAPACSDDAQPILKRGTQPALPPCPDPPPAASSPADSAPARSINPAEPLIERAREAAFEFSEKLPNFTCEEFMARYTERGRDEETPMDVVSAEIIYEDGQETYRDVKINDRPTDRACRKSVGPGLPESLRRHCWHFLTPVRTRSSGPAVRLLFRVSTPRFTTFKCGVKIHTGSCRSALRL